MQFLLLCACWILLRTCRPTQCHTASSKHWNWYLMISPTLCVCVPSSSPTQRLIWHEDALTDFKQFTKYYCNIISAHLNWFQANMRLFVALSVRMAQDTVAVSFLQMKQLSFSYPRLTWWQLSLCCLALPKVSIIFLWTVKVSKT